MITSLVLKIKAAEIAGSFTHDKTKIESIKQRLINYLDNESFPLFVSALSQGRVYILKLGNYKLTFLPNANFNYNIPMLGIIPGNQNIRSCDQWHTDIITGEVKKYTWFFKVKEGDPVQFFNQLRNQFSLNNFSILGGFKNFDSANWQTERIILNPNKPPHVMIGNVIFQGSNPGSNLPPGSPISQTGGGSSMGVSTPVNDTNNYIFPLLAIAGYFLLS